MSVYKPLFVYLTPASIPQVVAHIQKYLADNPILSDPEAIADAIQEYIEAHPEIIAVASVNGQTGKVVLTGSDIHINASQSVTIETQIANLASMIQSASGDITQIEGQLETIYTNFNELSGVVEGHTSSISGINTTLEGYGTRLTNVEGVASGNAEKNTQQDGRLNDLEGNVSTLSGSVNTLSGNVSTNTGNIETLQNFCNGISSFANLKVEFGTVNITGNETTPGQKEVTFSTSFTSAPFICTSIGGSTDTTFNERMLTAQVNGATNERFMLVCKRLVDGSGNASGWGGRATVRWMAIGA